MIPVVSAVNIPFFTKYIDSSGTFIADENLVKSCAAMLEELLVWTNGLKAMRQNISHKM
jgi:hypothetical protein